MLRVAWSEPLVHLMVGGLCLFALYAAVGDEDGSSEDSPSMDRTIVVDEGLRTRLTDDFQKRFGRNPNSDELATIVERFIDEEVLVREARAQNMSAGDVVIRQRLVQKMRLALDEGASQAAPSDEEVKTFYAANSKRYGLPRTTTLKHVFVDPAQSAELLDGLRDGRLQPEQAGKPFARGTVFRRHTDAKLSGIFGANFVKQLETLRLGTWQGPIPSSYGHHLVKVYGRDAGGPRPLAEVKDRVVRDMQRQRRHRGKGLERLRARFQIERR